MTVRGVPARKQTSEVAERLGVPAMISLQVDLLCPGTELAIAGRLDRRSAPLVRAVLTEAIWAGRGDLVVRVSDLEIWDREGMGVLIGAHGRARRHARRLVLAEVPPRQLRLLRATRFGRVLVAEPLVA